MNLSTTKPQTQLSFFTLDDKPYGKSWDEWCADWWRWALSMPKTKNPGMGFVESEAATSPVHDDVIFLVGAFDLVGGKQITHNLRIPAGKSVLLPVINCTNCFAYDPEMKTDDDLRAWAVKEISQIHKNAITINDNPVEQQTVPSDVFDLNWIEDNIFGIKPGPTRAVSTGFWLFIKSLPEGEYDISSYGSCMSGKVKIDAAYHITAR